MGVAVINVFCGARHNYGDDDDFWVYEITDPCWYCHNKHGFGKYGGGYCPVCERNYRVELEESSDDK